MFIRQVSGISGLAQNIIGRNIVPATVAGTQQQQQQRWISKSSEVDTLVKGQQQDQTSATSCASDKLHKGALRHKKNFRFVDLVVVARYRQENNKWKCYL